MIWAQSAVNAISLALKHDLPVQDVDYQELKELLVDAGQVLTKEK